MEESMKPLLSKAQRPARKEKLSEPKKSQSSIWDLNTPCSHRKALLYHLHHHRDLKSMGHK